MGRRRLAAIAALLLAMPAQARDSLGVFGVWGAFRDARPPRCFAIAEPLAGGPASRWKPFAAVATWPTLGRRNQLHIRMSRAYAGGPAPVLTVGGQSYVLIAGGADAWAPDARVDAAVTAAMRDGGEMEVTGNGAGGRIRDIYRLQGAATAIDAAALGCARLR